MIRGDSSVKENIFIDFAKKVPKVIMKLFDMKNVVIATYGVDVVVLKSPS